MEEKVLVTGEKACSSLSLALVTFSASIFFIVLFIVYKFTVLSIMNRLRSENLSLSAISGHFPFSYMLANNEFFFSFIAVICIVVSTIFGIILYAYWSKYEITITNKRIYGKTGFGKQVDLPISSVLTVGTNALSGISIGTSSGYINFKFIKNNNTVHSVISNMLTDKNQINNTTYSSSIYTSNSYTNNTNSNNDWKCTKCGRVNPSYTGTCACGMDKSIVLKNEIKKKEQELADRANQEKLKKIKEYKEMLDNDIISQEEFDEKKKQLLDL